jgi:hypothetical protein
VFGRFFELFAERGGAVTEGRTEEGGAEREAVEAV